MIEVRDLRYRYRTKDEAGLEALKGVSLVVHPGESLAVIGANGSGKSTLALCLNGLLTPGEGQVLVDGLDVAQRSNLDRIRRRVGMVFQNPDNQIISTTVEREIAFGLENLAVPGDELRRRVEEALEQFHLSDFRHRPPHLLSGGEKQRLSIAAVLAMQPTYLVLDEPTSLLDPVSRQEVRDLIRQLQEQKEVAVVHITQFPEEAAEARRVMVLHDGALAMAGPPEEVFADGEKLAELGLRPPFAMELADRLRQRGLRLPEPVGDLEELAAGVATIWRTQARPAARGAGERSESKEAAPDTGEEEPLFQSLKEGPPEGRAEPPDGLSEPLGSRTPPLARQREAREVRTRAKPPSDWEGQKAEEPPDRHKGWRTAPSAQERLRTENLWHRYNPGLPTEQVALRGVDLSIRRGELVGLVGPIGSGKSTLVQHLNGLLRPSSGRVLVDGQEVAQNGNRLQKLRRTVGLVFQFPEKQLFEETVFDDVAFGPRNLDLAEEEVSRRVCRALDLVGLDAEHFGPRSPFDLSGGEQRRVAIAGVLAMEPEVLILDEPFVGLDPQGCGRILDILGQLSQSGVTVLLISHHMDLVAPLVHRLVVMGQGQVVADGDPRDIFSDADRAAGLGIELPQAARLIGRLRQLGCPIQGMALSMGEAVEVMMCLGEKMDTSDG